MSETIVISGTRRAIRERVDGSLVVQVEIDPRFKADFLRLFPDIDAPIALAPLVADFEQREPEKVEVTTKGGPLAKLAGMLCNDSDFQRFIEARDSDHAAELIRSLVGVKSRAELDSDMNAAAEFHRVIRSPWLKYRASRGLK